MNIIISNANTQPIYEQICAQIKSAILSGELQRGEALPSIRSLAKDLRISVITTKRAYDELEREGFINSVAGKGSYVAEQNTELMRESALRELEEQLRAVARLCRDCGIRESELKEMYELIQKEEGL